MCECREHTRHSNHHYYWIVYHRFAWLYTFFMLPLLFFLIFFPILNISVISFERFAWEWMMHRYCFCCFDKIAATMAALSMHFFYQVSQLKGILCVFLLFQLALSLTNDKKPLTSRRRSILFLSWKKAVFTISAWFILIWEWLKK